MSSSPLHPAALDEERLLRDCDVRFTRRSGPGGQHRNKASTAAVLTHRPSGVSAEAGERRSQAENRRIALRRLRVQLALGLRRPLDAEQRPSERWRSRCRGGRLSINPKHADYPALLAEALDAIAAHEGDVKAAAERLGCSISQLVKLLRHEPRALEQVNREREARELHPLK